MWEKILELCKEGYIIRISSFKDFFEDNVEIRLTFGTYSSHRVIPSYFANDLSRVLVEIDETKRQLQEYMEEQEKMNGRNRMNKYIEAIEKIKNEYDAFYFENKYGKNTHEEEFKILEELKGEKVTNALGWIKAQYDCHYKEEIENEVDNPFDYLEDLAKQEKENENS